MLLLEPIGLPHRVTRLIIVVSVCWLFIFFHSRVTVAYIHASASGSEPIRFGWSHMKSCYIRFFGGYLLSAIPYILGKLVIKYMKFGMFLNNPVYAPSSGIKTLITALGSLVGLFLSLLPVVYASICYRELVGPLDKKSAA